MSHQNDRIQIISSPPRLDNDNIARPAIVNRLESMSPRRITALVAPVGFGKTAILNEWFSRLDVNKETTPCWITPTLLLSEHFDEFINRCNQHTGLITCFIDNLHTVDESQYDMLETRLEQLLSCASRVVVSSDKWIEPLQNLQLDGLLSSLPKTELLYSKTEVCTYIAQNTNLSATSSYASAVYDFTKGWPAGVYLLSIEPQANAPAFLLGKNIHIDRYIKTKILKNLHPEDIELFRVTAFCKTLTAQLCSYLTDKPFPVQTLSELSIEGFPLMRVDGLNSEFRCAQPFRKWMQTNIAQEYPDEVKALNLKISEYYESIDNSDRSAKYLLMACSRDLVRENFEFLLDLDLATNRYQGTDLASYLDLLSTETILDNPLRLLGVAWIHIRYGRFDNAQTYLEQCKRLLYQTPLSQSAHSTAKATLTCFEIKRLAMQGQSSACIDTCKTLLNDDDIRSNNSLTVVLMHSLAEGYEVTGKPCEAKEAYEELFSYAKTHHAFIALGFSVYVLAYTEYLQGNLFRAKKLCLSGNEEMHNRSMHGLLSATLARIGILENNLLEAEENLKAAQVNFPSKENADFYIDIQITQMRYLESLGRLEEAFTLSLDILQFANSHKYLARGYLRKTYLIHAELCLKTGRILRCKETLAKAESTTWTLNKEYLIMKLLCQGHLHHSEKDTDKALALLDQAVSESKEASYKLLELYACILRAVVYHSQDDQVNSFKHFNDALELGTQCGFVQPFLEYREASFSLLCQAISIRKLRREVRRFAQSLLDTISLQPKSPYKDRDTKNQSLTKRELEVLKLLNLGMSRKEIATELSISQNTVKSHVANCYTKLGVDNKLDAFHAARRLSN